MIKFTHVFISLIIGLIFTLLIEYAVGYFWDYLSPNQSGEINLFEGFGFLGIVVIVGIIGIPLFSFSGYFLIKYIFVSKD